MTPGWFARALAVPVDVGTVACQGCDINYLAWGRPGAPGLVFVHGGAAHAHWWSFVVPLLADTHRVVALDLSGHGDSGRRADYDVGHWTDEVMVVAADAAIGGPPIVVGHSMGGLVTIATAARHRADVAGIVVLDTPVRPPAAELRAARQGTAFGARQVYPDVDAALPRFRTVPPQDRYLPFVIDHVARHSLTPVDGGVAWKYDPNALSAADVDTAQLLPALSCRVGLLRSEHGLVTAAIAADVDEMLGHTATVVEIAEAGHHAMLDQPLLVLTALRTLLAEWNRSTPHPRR